MAAGVCLLLAGCAQRPAETPDQRLQQQAAQDARQVHNDLHQAGKEAEHALLNARRETQDVVAGARQGWKQGDRPGERGVVDVNRASLDELETLPGVTPATARHIVAGRPYTSAEDMVRQHVVSRSEWKRLEGKVSAD